MSSTVLGIADDRALGGTLRVIVTRPGSLRVAKAAVDEVVAAIDLAASRFRDDSELCRLNASPERDVAVSPLLAQAIAAALRGAKLSRGAVDPTIGSAIRLAGYDSDFADVPPNGDRLHIVAERIPGWRAVQLDLGSNTVRLPRGVELDLGATAKALASDLAAGAACKATGGGVLVSLGGDIAVAGEAPAEGWSIQTSDDSAAAIDDAEEAVTITSGGIATSSTTVRRWTRGGVVMHHIIDPATGLPADTCWRTASVVAATCVDANIASTAAIVMGRAAIAWFEGNRLPARLVELDGNVLRIAGWPERGGFGPVSK